MKRQMDGWMDGRMDEQTDSHEEMTHPKLDVHFCTLLEMLRMRFPGSPTDVSRKTHLAPTKTKEPYVKNYQRRWHGGEVMEAVEVEAAMDVVVEVVQAAVEAETDAVVEAES